MPYSRDTLHVLTSSLFNIALETHQLSPLKMDLHTVSVKLNKTLQSNQTD